MSSYPGLKKYEMNIDGKLTWHCLWELSYIFRKRICGGLVNICVVEGAIDLLSKFF